MSDNEFYNRFKEKMDFMRADAPIDLFSSYEKTWKTLTALVSLYYMFKVRHSGWILQDAIKALGLQSLNYIYGPAAICTGLGVVTYIGIVLGALLATRIEMDNDKIGDVGDFRIKFTRNGAREIEMVYGEDQARMMCEKYRIRFIPELEYECYRKIALNSPKTLDNPLAFYLKQGEEAQCR
jgi:hypothetical protein